MATRITGRRLWGVETKNCWGYFLKSMQTCVLHTEMKILTYFSIKHDYTFRYFMYRDVYKIFSIYNVIIILKLMASSRNVPDKTIAENRYYYIPNSN